MSETHPKTTGVVLNDVSKRFETGLTPISNVSFTIPPGEFVALLGPSGCGKTTLLRMIAGLTDPSAGQVQYLPSEATPPRLSYVFQEAHLLPWRNVLANVVLPLELQGLPREQSEPIAKAAIAKVGLSAFETYYPALLSGGMRMRVSLARSLVNQPGLLLLDEPFAALDEVTRFRLDEDLRGLWKASSMTVVFVTHSISEAAFLADRVLLFSKRTAGLLYDIKSPLGPERNLETRASQVFGAFGKELLLKFQELES